MIIIIIILRSMGNHSKHCLFLQMTSMVWNPHMLQMGPPVRQTTTLQYWAFSKRYWNLKWALEKLALPRLGLGMGLSHTYVSRVFLPWICLHVYLFHFLHQIWAMAACVCFVFTVTIGVFPAVTADVKPTIAGKTLWGKWKCTPL